MCFFFFEVNLKKPSMKVICTLLWWTTYPPVPLKPTATQATARVAQRKTIFKQKPSRSLIRKGEGPSSNMFPTPEIFRSLPNSPLLSRQLSLDHPALFAAGWATELKIFQEKTAGTTQGLSNEKGKWVKIASNVILGSSFIRKDLSFFTHGNK